MSNKTKKMSFLSILIFVVGGTIGAGIFFKNSTVSNMAQGKFGIVLATWGVAILGMIAIAISLSEFISSQKTKKGYLEWTQRFTAKWFHKASTNYTKWIFIPISLFTMPLYVTNTLEDAGMRLPNEMSALWISFAIFIWCMVVNLISLRFANVSQWVFTAIQIIPLVVLPIIGYANWGNVDSGTILDKGLAENSGLAGITPWLTLISGVSAISFAFDGFYLAASLKDEAKDRKSLSKGIFWGVIVVSIFYLFLTVGFNVFGSGNVYSFDNESIIPKGAYQFFQVGIAIGILGIVNAWAMSGPRQLEDTYKEGSNEIGFFRRLFKWTKRDEGFVAGWSFILVITTIMFLTIGMVGSFGYERTYSSEDFFYGGGHLYQLADDLTSFTSILVFTVIAGAILGALINRKTKKVETGNSKWFIPAGIISVVIVFASATYMIIEKIIDSTGFNGATPIDSLLTLIIFLVILGISVIPAVIPDSWKSRMKSMVIKNRT